MRKMSNFSRVEMTSWEVLRTERRVWGEGSEAEGKEAERKEGAGREVRYGAKMRERKDGRV